MKIAISTDEEYVSPHFGRCPSFTIVEVEDNKLIGRETIANPGHHPGFLPQFLRERGIGCIITGGMGQRASGLFAEQGVEPILGVSGTIEEVIDKLIKGRLEGAENICSPGKGRGYGIEKSECEEEG